MRSITSLMKDCPLEVFNGAKFGSSSWLRACIPSGHMPRRRTSSARRCLRRRLDISPSMNSALHGRTPCQCRKPLPAATAVVIPMPSMVLPKPVGATTSVLLVVVSQSPRIKSVADRA